MNVLVNTGRFVWNNRWLTGAAVASTWGVMRVEAHRGSTKASSVACAVLAGTLGMYLVKDAIWVHTTLQMAWRWGSWRQLLKGYRWTVFSLSCNLPAMALLSRMSAGLWRKDAGAMERQRAIAQLRLEQALWNVRKDDVHRYWVRHSKLSVIREYWQGSRRQWVIDFVREACQKVNVIASCAPENRMRMVQVTEESPAQQRAQVLEESREYRQACRWMLDLIDDCTWLNETTAREFHADEMGAGVGAGRLAQCMAQMRTQRKVVEGMLQKWENIELGALGRCKRVVSKALYLSAWAIGRAIPVIDLANFADAPATLGMGIIIVVVERLINHKKPINWAQAQNRENSGVSRFLWFPRLVQQYGEMHLRLLDLGNYSLFGRMRNHARHSSGVQAATLATEIGLYSVWESKKSLDLTFYLPAIALGRSLCHTAWETVADCLPGKK